MKLKHTALWSGVVAAALLLTACGKSNSGSGSMSSSGMSSSTASTAQNGAWKTGLGVLTETTDDHRTGKINLVAAAVLLDGEGKIIDVTFDELESTISADGSGVLSMPTDYRTKRQKGDDYPLAAASGIKKGWTEQADAFADYLKGMTAEKVAKLETEEDGKPKDADLLSSCTIAIDGYRDAVAKACANAEALGAAKGDRVSLGIEAANASSDVTATDDKDVNAQVGCDDRGPDRRFRWPGDQCHRGYGGARPDRDVGRQCHGSGRRENQAGAGRKLRDAGCFLSGQGVVRAQRGLLLLPQGKDRCRDCKAPGGWLGCGPGCPVHH